MAKQAFAAKIKLTVDQSGGAEFRKDIQTKVDEATKANPIKVKHITVSDRIGAVSLIKKIQTQLDGTGKGITVRIKQIDVSAAKTKLKSEIEAMLSTIKVGDWKAYLGEGSDASSQKKLADDTAEANQRLVEQQALLKQIKDTEKTLGKAYTAIGNVSDPAKQAELLAQYEALNVASSELRLNENLRTQEAVHNHTLAVLALQREAAAQKEVEKAAKDTAKTQQQSDQNTMASAKQIASLKSQITRVIASQSKVYKVYGKELDEMLSKLSDEKGVTVQTLNSVRASLVGITTSAKDAGVAGNTFFDTLRKGWEKFGGWSIVTKSMGSAIRVVRDMIDAVVDLDTAMTELRKVTNLTEATYDSFIKTASDRAKEIGATLTDTVNATADFARLGYDIADATALGEAALVYKNIGDGIEDIAESTESIISTIKAFEQFGITAEDAMSIVDKFNKVGNEFAISSYGIGTALKKSASALASAGNDLEESIALITAANSVVQNPETVGKDLPNGVVIRRKKITISVKLQRWTRPSKDFVIHRLQS